MIEIVIYVMGVLAGFYIGLTMFQHELRKLRKEYENAQVQEEDHQPHGI